MKFLLMFCLLSVSALSYAGPEWQILFPDQAAVVDGHYIDHNQALVVRKVENLILTGVMNLADMTGLNIPDNVAVTGFTAINDGGPIASTASYLFSLSASAGDYLRGDVIECNSLGCQVYAAYGSEIGISSLDYVNRDNDLLVSFDTGFSVNGQFINPAHVYNSSHFVVYFNSYSQGVGDNNSITAFDTSEFSPTFSASSMFDSATGLVKPAEVYSPPMFIESSITDELAEKVTGINAYYSVDSGWLGFEKNVINVSENASTVTFSVARVDGAENSTAVIARGIDGTAFDGIDYTGFFQAIYWADNNDDDGFVTVSLIDNDIADGTRSFTVELLEPNNSYMFSLVNPNKKYLTINILDDESGDLIFADGFE